MDYWELRKLVSKIIPRKRLLSELSGSRRHMREKGRKTNYQEFRLDAGKFEKQERLLDQEEIKSFLEVSLRASGCPMPLNLDVWDGLHCGFGCKYCYADNFRASLYTSFFDNARSVGMRHCNPSYYRTELDKLLPLRGTDPEEHSDSIKRAICMNVPIRLGIRFEDFLPIEGKKGISLDLIRYLAEVAYPLMINSKSDLLARDDYLEALTSNPAKTAVHITLISSNDVLLKRLEPGAPNFSRRLETLRALAQEDNIRAVARIEPYMVFLNDQQDEVEEYIDRVWEAGVRNITFDTYSYSANSLDIRRSIESLGYDYERTFLLTSDSQPIGSLLLGKFMDLFKQKGFSCSTFDLGNVPINDDPVCCCEVGDWFEGPVGFNHGSAVRGIRFVQENEGKVCSWRDYLHWMKNQGSFLSPNLEKDFKALWNLEGNSAFYLDWGRGMSPAGWDRDGFLWTYRSDYDFREDILRRLI